MAEHQIRVISPADIGGGFGPKAMFYPEDALVCWAARDLRRPVKWIEDRYEHFVTADQEREQVHTIELAFTKEGKLLGLRDVFVHDVGMYGALVAPIITQCTVPGPYKIANIHSELRAVYTNLQPTRAARGAGRRHARVSDGRTRSRRRRHALRRGRRRDRRHRRHPVWHRQLRQSGEQHTAQSGQDQRPGPQPAIA